MPDRIGSYREGFRTNKVRGSKITAIVIKLAGDSYNKNLKLTSMNTIDDWFVGATLAIVPQKTDITEIRNPTRYFET